jgi:hypothetical protein
MIPRSSSYLWSPVPHVPERLWSAGRDGADMRPGSRLPMSSSAFALLPAESPIPSEPCNSVNEDASPKKCQLCHMRVERDEDAAIGESQPTDVSSALG